MAAVCESMKASSIQCNGDCSPKTSRRRSERISASPSSTPTLLTNNKTSPSHNNNSTGQNYNSQPTNRSIPFVDPCDKQPDVADWSTAPNLPFRHTYTLQEAHNKPIFGIAFNSDNRSQSSDPLLFCTTAGHYITIYQCNNNFNTPDEAGVDTSSPKPEELSNIPPIVLLQSFADPVGDDEEFYCCAWSRSTVTNSLLPPGQQLVAASGKRGIIRLVCPSLASCPASLVGHGSSVNELKFHPKDPALLFSFSKDYTARLWNISNQTLVAIFGGAEGHRAEILHGDISLTGDLLLTASMDHCVKIWRLNTPDLANAIVASFKQQQQSSRLNNGGKIANHPTLIVEHFPEFSSRDVHGNYVDCARWFGSLVVSKSCENCVTIWKPGSLLLPESEGNDSSGQQQPHIECSNGQHQQQDNNRVKLPNRLKPIHQLDQDQHENQLINSSNNRAISGVPTEHKLSVIHQLKAVDCNLWYIRFDLANQLLALGTGTGPTRIYLWDLGQSHQALNLTPQVLQPTLSQFLTAASTPGRKGAGGLVSTGVVALSHSAVRQTRFANNGHTLICVGDNGLIIRFDRQGCL